MKFGGIKQVVSIFAGGLLVGLVISPWLEMKPQEVLVAPVDLIYAQSTIGAVPGETPLLDEHGDSSETLQRYFLVFDQEQRQWQREVMTSLEPVIGSDNYGSYSIAVIGDSMVDTMGTDMTGLRRGLSEYYPNMTFALYNYGIGSENVLLASERVKQAYEYKERQYPAIGSLGADIVVVGSFAYNPLGDSDEDVSIYEQKLSELIAQLQVSGTQVLFLATVAPLKPGFGIGPGGVNWEADVAWLHATKIQRYMEAGIAVATSRGVPVVDVYHETIHDDGAGVPFLVSAHDGIHPSSEGQTLIGLRVAEKIAELGWL